MAADLGPAYAHCEALLRAEDHDSWLAALFAPADLRRHLHALGAFALEVGQVRERVRQPLAGEIRLQWWQEVIDGERRADAAAHPVAAALLDTVVATDLPRATFEAVIDGHRAELYDEPPADFALAERRLCAVQGGMIALAAEALGADPAALTRPIADAAVALGIAAWLLRLRTVAEGNRVLLPVDVLTRHGAAQSDLDAGRPTPAIRAALGELHAVVRNRLAELRLRREAIGDAGPAFLTTALVEPSLKRTETVSDPFAPTPDLPPWRRQLRLWRAARKGGVL